MFIPLTNGWTEPTFVSKKTLPQDGIVHLEYTLPRLNNAEVIHGLQPVFVGYCTQWVLPDLGDGYKLNSNTVAAILDVPKDDKSSSGSDAKAAQRPPAKRYYSGARLIATVLRMVGPAPVDVPKQLQLKAGDRTIVISDSVTSDVGNLGDVDHILSGTYPDLKIPELIDAGVNGQMAEDLVLRFKQDVVEQKPQWVTISVGINDVLQRLDKPHDPKVLKKFGENVAKMVDMAQAAKIKVILLTPTIIQEDLANEGNRRLLLYVAAEKKIAKAKKCQLVDLHQMFVQALDTKPDYLKRTYLTEDGIHMNLPGGAIVAIGILRALGVPDADMVKAESAGSE
jgi:lysophospholipase L1-like esterase